MAEALSRHFRGNRLEARSAGLVPLGHIPSLTLEVLREAGISTDGLYSKGLSQAGIYDIDCLINLTELKIAPLVPPGFSGKLISYPVRDPFGQNIESYRKVREELEWLVKEKLPELIDAQQKGRG
jgi:protein-tyrosine-phosphatase